MHGAGALDAQKKERVGPDAVRVAGDGRRRTGVGEWPVPSGVVAWPSQAEGQHGVLLFLALEEEGSRKKEAGSGGREEMERGKSWGRGEIIYTRRSGLGYVSGL